MLARLSILSVQGQAVRHPQELADLPGAQLLARGEQGARGFTLSALSLGEVFQRRGEIRVGQYLSEFLWGRGRLGDKCAS